MQENKEIKSKAYSKIKIRISIFNIILTALFFILLIFFKLSNIIANYSINISSDPYLSFIVFIIIIGVIEILISLPLGFYSGFYLEHKFELSNQRFFKWIWENLKSIIVSSVIVLPILLIFLYLIRNYENYWWFYLGVFIFIISILLARIAPIIIMPLFYKFIPLENESLKERLTLLSKNAKVNVKGIFSFNMSKDTKKANAGFTGIGRSKRIIISDNLIDKFSEDEIETVFAHELGHYKFGHIRKGISISTFTTFLELYLIAYFYNILLPYFGFSSSYNFAAFPILGFISFIISLFIMPFSNAYSRMHEKEADEYALKTTRNKEAFISSMNKLSELNLSDKEPNKIIEFLFYSHPSIKKRIEYANGVDLNL